MNNTETNTINAVAGIYTVADDLVFNSPTFTDDPAVTAGFASTFHWLAGITDNRTYESLEDLRNEMNDWLLENGDDLDTLNDDYDIDWELDTDD